MVNFMGRLVALGIVGAGLFGGHAVAQAQDVALTYGGGRLNAALTLAEGKKLEDGVVVLAHGTLAHGKMEIIAHLQALLGERGISSLAPTLSLAENDRRGMYDCAHPHRHMHTDALDEIGAWLDWLDARRARNIVLAGHSRGGNQAAWFMAERAASPLHPEIAKVVLIAPATWNKDKSAASYRNAFKADLAPILARAQALVGAGKGDALIDNVGFIYCPHAQVSAASFVSYYGDDPRRDTPGIVAKIDRPVLIVAGSEDTVVPGLEKRIAALGPAANVRFVEIDGAGHFFRDLYGEDLADAMAAFITSRNGAQ